MANTEWRQRGPISGVPDVLQPVAHILLQVRESVDELVDGLTETEWNARPAGVASPAFHVRHMAGVIDRLFTYARGQSLSEAQFAALRNEGAQLLEADVPRTITPALSNANRHRGKRNVGVRRYREPQISRRGRRELEVVRLAVAHLLNGGPLCRAFLGDVHSVLRQGSPNDGSFAAQNADDHARPIRVNVDDAQSIPLANAELEGRRSLASVDQNHVAVGVPSGNGEQNDDVVHRIERRR